jgi:hypothetical protein
MISAIIAIPMAIALGAPAVAVGQDHFCGVVKLNSLPPGVYGNGISKPTIVRRGGRVKCSTGKTAIRRFFFRVHHEGRCHRKQCPDASPRGWRCGIATAGELSSTGLMAYCGRSGSIFEAYDPVAGISPQFPPREPPPDL